MPLTTPIFGFIGRPKPLWAHIQRAWGVFDYSLEEFVPADLPRLWQEKNYVIFNVASEYQCSIVSHCHSLGKCAQGAGRVDTLIRQEDGWHGLYTLKAAWDELWHQAPFSLTGRKILVVGSTPPSPGLKESFEAQKPKNLIYATGGFTAGNLRQYHDSEIIIRTPSMESMAEKSVSFKNFPALIGLADLRAYPLRSLPILKAEKQGYPVQTGLFARVTQIGLALQAKHKEEGSQLDFLGKSKDVTENLSKSLTNIVLIGMPGVGKSTLGRRLALMLKRPLVDLDEVITRRYGRTPAEIICQDGEPAFRRLEHELVADYGGKSGLVLATGGGAVTVEANLLPLAQQGHLIWLQRPLAELATKGRPLSQDGLESLWEARKDLYAAFADRTLQLTDDSASIIYNDFKPSTNLVAAEKHNNS